MVFYKTQSAPVTPENYHQLIMVISVNDTAIGSLYHAVQKVFSPALIKSSSNKTLDPKLQSLISELEAGLGATLRRRGNDKAKSDKTSGKESTAGKYLQVSR